MLLTEEPIFGYFSFTSVLQKAIFSRPADLLYAFVLHVPFKFLHDISVSSELSLCSGLSNDTWGAERIISTDLIIHAPKCHFVQRLTEGEWEQSREQTVVEYWFSIETVLRAWDSITVQFRIAVEHSRSYLVLFQNIICVMHTDEGNYKTTTYLCIQLSPICIF